MKTIAQALGCLGWVEGKNIRVDYRFAAGDPAVLKVRAAELVSLAPDAILAITASAVAALLQETRTTPIVFTAVPDPVELGFVQSLARPGRNITGFTSFDAPIMGKWLQLLEEVAPRVTRVSVIFNPDINFSAPLYIRAIEAAAPTFGMTVALDPVHDDAGIEEAIAILAREPGGGVICLTDSFTITHRDVIIGVAARHSFPLIGGTSGFPRAGGLMTYWPDAFDQDAQAASYIDRILKGASPADLPVQQPTKYRLIINLKTAKALGLTVPERLLALADRSSSEQAPIHRRPRRSRRMAARRARPTVRADAPRRRVDAWARERLACACDGLCQCAGPFGVERRKECPDRVPLCRERPASLQDLRGGAGRPGAGRAARHHPAGADSSRRRRTRYRSFSSSWSIRSGWAWFRVSRTQAATSPGSALWIRR